MANPFATKAMAAGYARRRPPVHRRVVEMAASGRGWRLPFWRAVDVGCGAGVSTKALAGMAEEVIGVEPAAGMLRGSGAVAPEAWFVAGAAEMLPLADGSCALMTAAGSLNYVDLAAFFPEARRVLTPEGTLLVYDFSPGRRFREVGGLQEWFEEFQRRYPPPVAEARALDPEILGGLAAGFELEAAERFELGVTLSRDFYVGYMMTETNVAAAMRAGAAEAEIEGWCRETLEPVWGETEREVVFAGYWACLKLAGGC
ncbi:MAG: methyltransferase domain-containing protein [Bryobacteraceae bacterium]|nr:methyltransferase domain-containing protein [Bryobacteraceae bacterium]